MVKLHALSSDMCTYVTPVFFSDDLKHSNEFLCTKSLTKMSFLTWILVVFIAVVSDHRYTNGCF